MGSAVGGEAAPLHSTSSHASHTSRTATPASTHSHAAPTTTSGAAVDTNQRQDTGAEPKAPGNVASPAETTSGTGAGEGAEGAAATEPEGGYPEQVHAGKLGYGPHYAGNPGISDQLKGTEEIIKGKVGRLLATGTSRQCEC